MLPLRSIKQPVRRYLDGGEPRKKVLVIEDEPSIRNNIMLMLKVERYAADRSGKRPRRPWSWHGAIRPISILCDVMMPENGRIRRASRPLRAEPRFCRNSVHLSHGAR